jgi:uncharacterized protein YllA (UPF0747 family)
LYVWFPNSVTVEEFVEGTEENRERYREETDEERLIRNFDELIEEIRRNGEPAETPVRAGMRNVLLGKD